MKKKLGFKENKWVNGAIPALLIHCSIGTVYCWSLLKDAITQRLGSNNSIIEWAFSLAIFFLGMSAAFGGNLVEKNVTKSAVVSMMCFTMGLVFTGVSITLGSTFGVLMSYGCLMGIGLGIGYLTPVKTLMMWFSEHKGLATGIAITGFGLAKVIASPLIEYLLGAMPIEHVFYSLAILYSVMMCIGAVCIKKPTSGENLKGTPFKFKEAMKFITNKQYLAIWFVFFLNITCGLALISQEKIIVNYVEMGMFVALISSLTAALNSLGRFGYSTVSDRVKDRGTIYKIIFATSLLFCLFTAVSLYYNVTVLLALSVIFTLLICNAGYGGGFSTLPSLLSDRFGMKNVSVIHGFALSAWAWAGLAGNQLGHYTIEFFGYDTLFFILFVLYAVAFGVTYRYIVPRKKKNNKRKKERQ